MSDHEQVSCPRCHAFFVCKSGSISLCQCTTVSLSVDESHYISNHYSECLCAPCMLEMKKEYNTKLLEQRFSSISTLFKKNN
ncbi:cysteine-rich CWC family protein [Fluviicola sp.]|uniref:cysteine-rich CWC family protein n=1 Tax=Fluviicola sp. TaxID=1917219 RepID=UPI00262D07BF|nr:cysteine-rich CWC family protein [Fluviicola sp.]